MMTIAVRWQCGAEVVEKSESITMKYNNQPSVYILWKLREMKSVSEALCCTPGETKSPILSVEKPNENEMNSTLIKSKLKCAAICSIKMVRAPRRK